MEDNLLKKQDLTGNPANNEKQKQKNKTKKTINRVSKRPPSAIQKQEEKLEETWKQPLIGRPTHMHQKTLKSHTLYHVS